MSHRSDNPLASDLDNILDLTKGLWEEFQGRRIFITGGTGFFGIWLLESLAWANAHLGLDVSMLVLTRDIDSFHLKAPHLAFNPAIQFHVGDIRDFEFPAGRFSHVIHAAATSAIATFNNEDPLSKFDTLVQGTRRTLDFAVKCGAEKVLLTSSGSAYGRQPASLTHISEDYTGGPDSTNPSMALGEGKRTAEFLCSLYSHKFGFETKIARCFSFVGPHLQMDLHYAIGNFIRDAIAGGPIRVMGDGSPRRSYLYATDLMVWLWTILTKGKSCYVYNVGSEKDLSIAELAKTVAQCFEGSIPVEIVGSSVLGCSIDRYVPSTQRAQSGLGLRETVDLKSAISLTVAYQAITNGHRLNG
jgi:nucleoside-diphosphate-sugar epimerase